MIFVSFFDNKGVYYKCICRGCGVLFGYGKMVGCGMKGIKVCNKVNLWF